jgi:AcrR family transcriptional regulator
MAIRDKTEKQQTAETHGRDSAATRQRILEAACKEFAQFGYSGGRMDRIAHGARSNVQMIYRYFGGKDELYLAVLEDTYSRIRALERQLDLAAYPPIGGMRKLVEFTFDYLLENPDFVKTIRNENVVGGEFARRSTVVPSTTYPLLDAITDLLKQGRASGAFKVEIDPMQLYITILGLCLTHLSNRHTLSVMFQRSLEDSKWLAERRDHACDVILSYLTNPRP